MPKRLEVKAALGKLRHFTIREAQDTDKNNILMDIGTRLLKCSFKPNPVRLDDKLGSNGCTKHFEPLLLTFEVKRA